MTIEGNEPQPIPADQTPPIVPEATPPAPEPTDPDEIELRDAMAAAKAEEAAVKPSEPDPATAGTPTPAAPAPQDPTPPGKPAVQMIPKPRFDEVNTRATKAEQDAAYWRGVAEARAGTAGAPAAPGQTPAPPQETPEQRLASIRTEKQALAKKFDDGEMTMADYEAKRDLLDDKVQAIREEARPKAPAPDARQGGDELYLETLTANLETQHPWVKVFDTVGSDADWAYLSAQATERLAARGIDPKVGTMGRYELRKELAALADELGPALLTARAAAKGVAVPGQTPATPQPQQPAPLSQTALARQAKLVMAANAPPDITSMTNAGGANAGQHSDAQIEAMSEEDYDKLPAATRNRLLGKTA